MQLLLAPPIIKRLKLELRRAGRREIGGLLMGEHLGGEIFRVIDISVQHSGGSQSCFVRNPRDHQSQLQEFFARTGENYARFNYLGEWHSHPSYEPFPSATDLRTMQSIVEDPDVGVNFVVLIIAKLSSRKGIETTAMAFRAYTDPAFVAVSLETTIQVKSEIAAYRWLRRIFRL
jgi:integrative and conjugative element protein (TIGR02256 family)